jgi:hypothetical protein
MEEVFSFQPWLRWQASPECHRGWDKHGGTVCTSVRFHHERLPELPYRVDTPESSAAQDSQAFRNGSTEEIVQSSMFNCRLSFAVLSFLDVQEMK